MSHNLGSLPSLPPYDVGFRDGTVAERARIRARLAEHRVYIEFDDEEDCQGWYADCVCGGFCEPCSTPETAWQAWLDHIVAAEETKAGETKETNR